VVLDTNVFVSTLLRGGGAARAVLRQALSKEVVPLFANALFSEYEALLARHHVWETCSLSAQERQDILDALLACGQWVRIHFLWRPNLGDEADNHVLELAVAGGAEAIITSNTRDFVRSELSFPTVKVLTPRQFLE
jgi:putative PIN family toxin of toxin-antitoxin system